VYSGKLDDIGRCQKAASPLLGAPSHLVSFRDLKPVVSSIFDAVVLPIARAFTFMPFSCFATGRALLLLAIWLDDINSAKFIDQSPDQIIEPTAWNLIANVSAYPYRVSPIQLYELRAFWAFIDPYP
jgi:hypothetical protein